MLKEIKDICEPLIKEHMKDVPYKIEYVDRGVKYLGKCVYKKNRGNYYTLKFSSIYFNNLYKKGNVEQIKDTVLHEVAHALCREIHGGNHGHDMYWRRIAYSIGCNGERCARTGIVPYKYIYKCSKCGCLFYRLRKLPSGMQHTRDKGNVELYKSFTETQIKVA